MQMLKLLFNPFATLCKLLSISFKTVNKGVAHA